MMWLVLHSLVTRACHLCSRWMRLASASFLLHSQTFSSISVFLQGWMHFPSIRLPAASQKFLLCLLECWLLVLIVICLAHGQATLHLVCISYLHGAFHLIHIAAQLVPNFLSNPSACLTATISMPPARSTACVVLACAYLRPSHLFAGDTGKSLLSQKNMSLSALSMLPMMLVLIHPSSDAPMPLTSASSNTAEVDEDLDASDTKMCGAIAISCFKLTNLPF